MPIARHVLTLASTEPIAFHDLTGAVRAWVRGTGLRDGLLTVSTPHTTARVVVNEREPALQRDMARFLQRLAPAANDYLHDRDTVDDRPNAHAHLLALLMPASESIPVVDGEPRLGTWQALFFVELDGPRARREVHLQLLAPA
jgi:secondary thiamine-phosphate synthase enzyme